MGHALTRRAGCWQVEADSYWCLCKLLEGIQDHYTYAQPGIQRTVFHLKELVRCAQVHCRGGYCHPSRGSNAPPGARV